MQLIATKGQTKGQLSFGALIYRNQLGRKPKRTKSSLLLCLQIKVQLLAGDYVDGRKPKVTSVQVVYRCCASLDRAGQVLSVAGHAWVTWHASGQINNGPTRCVRNYSPAAKWCAQTSKHKAGDVKSIQCPKLDVVIIGDCQSIKLTVPIWQSLLTYMANRSANTQMRVFQWWAHLCISTETGHHQM